MNLIQYIRTIRYLKPRQIYGLYLSRYPRRVPRDDVAFVVRPVKGHWTRPIASPTFQTGPSSFAYANGARDVKGADGWDDQETPKLWLYNLHYFDDLVSAGAESRRAWHVELMSRWLAENQPTAGVGWEPYPTSCRIVNWIKWAIGGAELPTEARCSLALQARYLRRNLEWRLMANHLFMNLKALLFAGCFFDGTEAGQWRSDALRLLREQIAEQVLSDGGHCEQSPMYHTIVLGDLLDLVNLAQAYPECVPPAARQLFSDTSCAMFTWLARMCHPDGGTSFFSDGGFASYGAGALWDYAQRLDLPVQAPPAQRVCHLQATGYVRLQTADTVVLFDVGEIGPQYQPGHGHADALSFELSHRGARILVNPGTSTYTEGHERSRQRGTASHNTVAVDGLDQSEMWGGFRVARRAHPRDVQTEEWGDIVAAEGSHDGYGRLRHPILHRRRVELSPGVMHVRDTLEGVGHHQASVRFHVHPEFTVHLDGGGFRIGNSKDLLLVELDPVLQVSIEESSFHPRFGVSRPNLAIRGDWRGVCPVSWTTRIELL
ncbi:MAG: alginate lyase family protein [Acidobacteria bacterium]|nr:alginate lyase family protein [Acidobacteriota bacterium]